MDAPGLHPPVPGRQADQAGAWLHLPGHPARSGSGHGPGCWRTSDGCWSGLPGVSAHSRRLAVVASEVHFGSVRHFIFGRFVVFYLFISFLFRCASVHQCPSYQHPIPIITMDRMPTTTSLLPAKTCPWHVPCVYDNPNPASVM